MPTLADTIAAEAAVVARFIALLSEEQQVLQSGDIDRLTDLAERKTAVARELAPLSAARNAELSRAGLAPDRSGLEDWLARSPRDTRLNAEWQRLQALATEAKELNRVNGELIQLRMQHNAQALEALLAANSRQDLYGADGQASQSTARRIIDSA